MVVFWQPVEFHIQTFLVLRELDWLKSEICFRPICMRITRKAYEVATCLNTFMRIVLISKDCVSPFLYMTVGPEVLQHFPKVELVNRG